MWPASSWADAVVPSDKDEASDQEDTAWEIQSRRGYFGLSQSAGSTHDLGRLCVLPTAAQWQGKCETLTVGVRQNPPEQKAVLKPKSNQITD